MPPLKPIARTGTARRRGNSLIEFTLLGIPLIFISIAIVAISINMWEFHTLAYATEATSRYISLHCATCAQNGNTCTITVGTIATLFKSRAMALDPAQTTLTLTDGSGTTTCNPITSCTASATQFPNASYRSVGSDVTVKASYTLRNPIALFWPPAVDVSSLFTVAAKSRVRIQF